MTYYIGKALEVSTKNENIDAVNLLLDKKSSNLTTELDNSLVIASKINNYELVDIFFKHSRILIKKSIIGTDTFGEALLESTKANNFKIVDRIIQEDERKIPIEILDKAIYISKQHKFDLISTRLNSVKINNEIIYNLDKSIILNDHKTRREILSNLYLSNSSSTIVACLEVLAKHRRTKDMQNLINNTRKNIHSRDIDYLVKYSVLNLLNDSLKTLIETLPEKITKKCIDLASSKFVDIAPNYRKPDQ